MERGSTLARHNYVRAGLWLAGTSLLPCLTGCGLDSDDRAAATWVLASDQDLDPDVAELTVLVTRLGCNNGVTGTVQAPDVQFEADRVILTFQVTPGQPAEASCPDNNPVTHEVVLDEPVGDRALVDGQCLPGGTAEDTADCGADGIRYRPADG